MHAGPEERATGAICTSPPPTKKKIWAEKIGTSNSMAQKSRSIQHPS